MGKIKHSPIDCYRLSIGNEYAKRNSLTHAQPVQNTLNSISKQFGSSVNILRVRNVSESLTTIAVVLSAFSSAEALTRSSFKMKALNAVQNTLSEGTGVGTLIDRGSSAMNMPQAYYPLVLAFPEGNGTYPAQQTTGEPCHRQVSAAAESAQQQSKVGIKADYKLAMKVNEVTGEGDDTQKEAFYDTLNETLRSESLKSAAENLYHQIEEFLSVKFNTHVANIQLIDFLLLTLAKRDEGVRYPDWREYHRQLLTIKDDASVHEYLRSGEIAKPHLKHRIHKDSPKKSDDGLDCSRLIRLARDMAQGEEQKQADYFSFAGSLTRDDWLRLVSETGGRDHRILRVVSSVPLPQSRHMSDVAFFDKLNVLGRALSKTERYFQREDVLKPGTMRWNALSQKYPSFMVRQFAIAQQYGMPENSEITDIRIYYESLMAENDLKSEVELNEAYLYWLQVRELNADGGQSSRLWAPDIIALFQEDAARVALNELTQTSLNKILNLNALAEQIQKEGSEVHYASFINTALQQLDNEITLANDRVKAYPAAASLIKKSPHSGFESLHTRRILAAKIVAPRSGQNISDYDWLDRYAELRNCEEYSLGLVLVEALLCKIAARVNTTSTTHAQTLHKLPGFPAEDIAKFYEQEIDDAAKIYGFRADDVQDIFSIRSVKSRSSLSYNDREYHAQFDRYLDEGHVGKESALDVGMAAISLNMTISELKSSPRRTDIMAFGYTAPYGAHKLTAYGRVILMQLDNGSGILISDVLGDDIVKRLKPDETNTVLKVLESAQAVSYHDKSRWHLTYDQIIQEDAIKIVTDKTFEQIFRDVRERSSPVATPFLLLQKPTVKSELPYVSGKNVLETLRIAREAVLKINCKFLRANLATRSDWESLGDRFIPFYETITMKWNNRDYVIDFESVAVDLASLLPGFGHAIKSGAITRRVLTKLYQSSARNVFFSSIRFLANKMITHLPAVAFDVMSPVPRVSLPKKTKSLIPMRYADPDVYVRDFQYVKEQGVKLFKHYNKGFYFIQDEQWFRIRWDDYAHTWRLIPPSRGYEPPVRITNNYTWRIHAEVPGLGGGQAWSSHNQRRKISPYKNIIGQGNSGDVVNVSKNRVKKIYHENFRSDSLEHPVGKPDTDCAFKARNNARGMNLFYGENTAVVRLETIQRRSKAVVEMNRIKGSTLKNMCLKNDMNALLKMRKAINDSQGKLIDDVVDKLVANRIVYFDFNPGNIIYDFKSNRINLIDFDDIQLQTAAVNSRDIVMMHERIRDTINNALKRKGLTGLDTATDFRIES